MFYFDYVFVLQIIVAAFCFSFFIWNNKDQKAVKWEEFLISTNTVTTFLDSFPPPNHFHSFVKYNVLFNGGFIKQKLISNFWYIFFVFRKKNLTVKKKDVRRNCINVKLFLCWCQRHLSWNFFPLFFFAGVFACKNWNVSIIQTFCFFALINAFLLMFLFLFCPFFFS